MTLLIKENIPLAPLTTFNIGGPARYFTEVRSVEEIKEAITIARERKLPLIILAGGSNVLVPDEGLNALVISILLTDFKLVGNVLESEAGCNLLSMISETTRAGLGGWENLAGIPGTIGGAIRGNAGAFGTEIKDVAVKVGAFNIKTGKIKEFSNSESEFAYRNSFFKKNPDWFITKVAVGLHVVDYAKSARFIETTITEREKRHLQNIQAAGSYFMNPVAPKEVQEMFEREKGMKSRKDRVPAGWLIEKAGMKGAKVGGAIASLQHPNYLVNTGGATALDVRNLAEKIKQAVKKQYGIGLEEEAVIMRL